jgi:histidine triad (HIT) family protein
MNPATPGHSIVIPRRHSADLREIEPGDLEATIAAAQRLGVRAIDALGADGLNLLNCCGEAAWQTVAHFHVHVVPRYNGDPLELPSLPVQGDRADRAVVAARLRERAESERLGASAPLAEPMRGQREPREDALPRDERGST